MGKNERGQIIRFPIQNQRALFVGRFQPFHNGHLAVVKKLLSRHREVIVLVGSSGKPLSRKNPFTAGERIGMIRACFSSRELARLIIVPLCDINNDSLWVSHVTAHVPGFGIVYSNNTLVKSLFLKAGIKAVGLGFFDRYNHEARKIRALMASGSNEWEKRVPKKVVGFMESIGGIERLKRINRPREAKAPRRAR